MGIHLGNNGAKTVRDIYLGVNGSPRKVTKGYIGVGGLPREFYSAGTPLGTFTLGAIVKVRESGTLQDFYVAKHGYPTAGNGRTLLVRRYIYDMRKWHTGDENAYATSAIDTWLTGAYLNLLPADIRGQVTAVSIPYTPGNGNNVLSTLSRKVFLLSLTELGHAHQYANAEGSTLSIASTLQIATDSAGTAQIQWTRSPHARATSITGLVWFSGTGGNFNYNGVTSAYGARPAFTLPSTLMVDDNGCIG